MVFAFATAAALAALSPATAQTPGGADNQDIVVEGSRDRTRPATEYLDQILPPVMDAHIGRFEDPLCPSTVGLPDNLRVEVLARLRQVAAVAKIPVAAGRCTPNLLIIVVDDKKALIEGMKRQKESYLYGLGSDRVKRMEEAAGPVAAWQITDVIGADGMPLRRDGDGFPRLFTTVPPSRVVDTTRERILAGVVVLEQRGLIDVTTRQLADFALLRLLAPIQSRDRVPPASSILSLFNPGLNPEVAPQSVTWWDLAFLKALSDTRSDLVAGLQWHEIRDKMVDEMARLRRNN